MSHSCKTIQLGGANELFNESNQKMAGRDEADMQISESMMCKLTGMVHCTALLKPSGWRRAQVASLRNVI